MWSYQALSRIDYRVVPVIFALMAISLLILASFPTGSLADAADEPFFNPMVRTQLKWFVMGMGVFAFCAGFDYNKLREWTWILYLLMIICLIGLFFTDPIARVHRWYRIPFLGMSFQPSEYAKLGVVLALSWYFERRRSQSYSWSTTFGAILIAGIPFLLILKQPDLGSALVLFPITVVMFYFGEVNPIIVRLGAWVGVVMLVGVAIMFLGIIPHEAARPYVTKVIREYQYERLNPNTHHQKASATAIAIGGVTGTGWAKGDYARGGWLPAPSTDSVFSTFGEEFGLIGIFFLMALFYALIYFSFQVVAVAKDYFGRLLAAGIAVYLAIHVLVNIGMMCGVLPITGVPLILVTYGGSSVLSTMMALGILQSIYSRRFMF